MPAADSQSKEAIEFKRCADGTIDVDAALAAAKEKKQASKGGKGKKKAALEKKEEPKKVRTVEQLPGGTTGNKKLDALLKKDIMPTSAADLEGMTDEQKDELRSQLKDMTHELTGQLQAVGSEMSKIKGMLNKTGGLQELTKEIQRLKEESDAANEKLDISKVPGLDARMQELLKARAYRAGKLSRNEVFDGLPENSWLAQRKKMFSFWWCLESFVLFCVVFTILFTVSPVFREATRQLIGYYTFGVPMDMEKLGFPSLDSDAAGSTAKPEL